MGTDGEEPAQMSSYEFAQTAEAVCSSPRGYRKTLDGASKQKRPIGCCNDRDLATIGSVTSTQGCSWGHTQPAPHGHVQTRAAAPTKSRTLTEMGKQPMLHQTASLQEQNEPSFPWEARGAPSNAAGPEQEGHPSPAQRGGDVREPTMESCSRSSSRVRLVLWSQEYFLLMESCRLRR